MPKPSIRFVCQQCGHESLKWLGKCPACGQWGTMAEEQVGPEQSPRQTIWAPPQSRPYPLPEVQLADSPRLASGIAEFDRVLGGGVVPGSLILIGGDPGIGKSTLLIQIAENVSRQHGPVLYVSGEESLQQIKMRCKRLGANSPSLYLLAETDIAAVEHHAKQLSPRFLMIDSIQTMTCPEVASTAGTVSQVRTSAAALMRFGKSTDTPVFLVGHVTKEGAIAGPRVLEHMVDTVLYFEGDRNQNYRILRAVKNRFGSTNELGIFEMRETGLAEVENPSEYLLSERSQGGSGTVVTPVMEGTRPLLVEVQALSVPTYLAAPRRVATGVDYGRLLLILAVLERRAGFRVSNHDVYISVAGGVRVGEPAADLAVAIAVASNLKDTPIPPELVVSGEVGLGGEIRAVGQLDKRLAEAARLGFTKAIVPSRSMHRLARPEGMTVIPARTVLEAAHKAFDL
ncbi:MAG: DNA repair protein RadA [Armatimonadota bacterium]